jgi:hypothetical protein
VLVECSVSITTDHSLFEMARKALHGGIETLEAGERLLKPMAKKQPEEIFPG